MTDLELDQAIDEATSALSALIDLRNERKEVADLEAELLQAKASLVASEFKLATPKDVPPVQLQPYKLDVTRWPYLSHTNFGCDSNTIGGLSINY